MGGAFSSNVTNNTVSAITNQSISILNDSTIGGKQSIIIDLRNIKGDVNIDGNNFDQTAKINLSALQTSLATQASQTSIITSLTQSAKSLVSGLNIGQVSVAMNQVNNLISATTNESISTNMKCMIASQQSITIKIDVVGGSVNIRNNSFSQLSELVSNCVQQATANQQATTELQTTIDQSASATSQGLSEWALVVVICVFLIVGGATTGTIVKNTIGTTTRSVTKTLMSIIGIVTIIVGIVFLSLYYNTEAMVWTSVCFFTQDFNQGTGTGCTPSLDKTVNFLTDPTPKDYWQTTQDGAINIMNPELKGTTLTPELLAKYKKVEHAANLTYVTQKCEAKGLNAFIYRPWTIDPGNGKTTLSDITDIKVSGYSFPDPEACFISMRDLAKSQPDNSKILTLRNAYLDDGFVSTNMLVGGGMVSDLKIDETTLLGINIKLGNVCVALNTNNVIFLVWVVDINKPFDKLAYNSMALTGVQWDPTTTFIYQDAPNYYPDDDSNDNIYFGPKDATKPVTATGKTKWLCLANPAAPILYTFQKKQGVKDDIKCDATTGAPKWYDGDSNSCEWSPKFLQTVDGNRPDALPDPVIVSQFNFVPNTMGFRYVARKKWMLYTGIPLIVFGIIMMILPYIIKGKPTTGEAVASEAVSKS